MSASCRSPRRTRTPSAWPVCTPAAASVIATLRADEDEGIVDHEIVGEVRGSGVFWAVELVADRTTREPVSAAVMGGVKSALVDAGDLPFTAENRVHVVPPAVVTEDELDEGLSILDAVLGARAL